MEEDQEIIQKLMAMLGNGKEIKFKSPDGQTIKVSFQGNSYNQTSLGSSKSHLSENNTVHNNSEVPTNQLPVQREVVAQNADILSQIKDDLQQMANDFNCLSIIQQNHFTNINESQDQFSIIDFKTIDDISQNLNIFSKSQDNNSLKELIGQQSQENLIKKTKKIQLTKKRVKPNNETVINFFQSQNSTLQKDNIVPDIYNCIPIRTTSSPLTHTQKSDISNLPHNKSQSIKQSINKLKELHPESQKIVQIISERINQLEQIEKSISLMNSSISNSLSINFQSFQVSMLSFNKNFNDPLCHLMAQFINKARQGKNQNIREIPSSFLFLYSQPLLYANKEQILNQIDYYEEEHIIKSILKEGKCKVDYIHTPATIEKFYYWITQGVQILHFCGHGIQGQQNYLIFQSEGGQAQHLTVSHLHDLLSSSKISLKLVFVASCHSQSVGQVFFQAGASHVICIKDEYKILDEACHQFVKLFYLSCINSKLTICEAFQFSKKQMILKGRFGKHECQKFIIIRNHITNHCNQHFEHRNQIQNFNDLNPRPAYNKYMLSRVEHYIPRSKQIFQIMQLINQKRRYITIVGQSGLGKSTLARQLVRYIQFRNLFIDGIVYLQLSQCQTIAKIFQLLDIQFFQVSQLRLSKTLIQNSIRLSKEIAEKNLLIVFDNCQNIMASQDKQNFKKITQILMKNCIKVYFIFTNRYSISKQIDYCCQALFQLQKLTQNQAKALFFKKIPRTILKTQYDAFFRLDDNKQLRQISQHSFFQFLNGHPQAICLTASLLSQRTLPQLHTLFLEPDINREFNKNIQRQLMYTQGVHKIVSTAMRISLNVIHHKYKDCSEMIKILSLLPNGLEKQMMNKIFVSSDKWKDLIKRLIDLSLIQCIQRGGVRYYMVNPQIIRQVENQIGLQDKIRYHQKICQEYVKRINKLYRTVGTSSQYSQRAQELFLIEQDNYRAIFFRQLNFIGQKYPLRKFYQNLFKCEYEGMDEQQKNDFGQNKLTNAQILNIVEINKKKKNLQALHKRQAIDLILIYYSTILFIIKKGKNTSLQTYLNYAFVISHKRNKYIVIANLLRIKACIYITQGHDNQAKMFFQIAHAQFAQLGCGLGSACCQAALGYIKFYESEYAPAKKNLQNALKYYQQIPHPFGKHYLNRWLCSLKSKMNKQERQLVNHKMQAQKLLKQTKQLLRSNNFNNLSCIKHKFGYFAFRFLFDNISLFLEATFQIDLKPKFINQQAIKKNQRASISNVLGQYSNLSNCSSNNFSNSISSHLHQHTQLNNSPNIMLPNNNSQSSFNNSNLASINPNYQTTPRPNYQSNISHSLYSLDNDEPDEYRKKWKLQVKPQIPDTFKETSQYKPENKIQNNNTKQMRFSYINKDKLDKSIKLTGRHQKEGSLTDFSNGRSTHSNKKSGLQMANSTNNSIRVGKQMLPIIKQAKQIKQKKIGVAGSSLKPK